MRNNPIVSDCRKEGQLNKHIADSIRQICINKIYD